MGVVDYDWDLEGVDFVEDFVFVNFVDYLLGQSVDKSWSVPDYLIVVPPDRDAPMMKAVPGIFEMSL